MTNIPLHYEDALSVATKIHCGETTSVRVTEALLRRIMEVDADLGAYVRLTEATAIAQAEAADKSIAEGVILSPLHGVPVAVKDLLDTKGIPTTYGMPLNNNNVPSNNATVIQKLANAGTVLLGKLKLTEGAYSKHHPDVSPPVNPWNANCWVGASSSGSGVATAAGLCFGSIGSDTGGSIRFPSAANGIVGLKPTWGRVSRAGVFPLAYSLDHIGPMTRSVGDAAAMLGIIAGSDERDLTSSPKDVPDYLSALNGMPSELTIGIDRSYIEKNTHPEAVAAVMEVADCLVGAGGKIVDITIPYESSCEGWAITTAVEALHAHNETFPSRKEEYGPIGALLQLGQTIDAASYMQIEMGRRELKALLADIYQKVDIILCPSMPFYALPKEGSAEMDAAEQNMADTLKFTAPYDYSGNPTLSLPWRIGSEKIPVGVQLIGRAFEESLLLKIGHYIEQQSEHPMHPKEFP